MGKFLSNELIVIIVFFTNLLPEFLEERNSQLPAPDGRNRFLWLIIEHEDCHFLSTSGTSLVVKCFIVLCVLRGAITRYT